MAGATRRSKGADAPAASAPKRKRRKKRRKAADPSRGADEAPRPADAEPQEAAPVGQGLAFALAAVAAMVGISLLPSMAGRGAVQLHTWIAAGIAVAAILALRGSGRPLAVIGGIKRPHYMQAITQIGVYLWWSTHWAPVKGQALLIVVQIAFAYLCEMLLCWVRDRPWRAGFGPMPITLSVNLFLWFKDPHFGWQLALIALCYLGKDMIRWERGGTTRHIFNPSSFGLGVVSAILLVSGTSGATFAREIAVTQEETHLMWEALFALGLIVQVQFPVVLVTMASAVTCWLLGKLWFAWAGTYMFATTDIPAAVFLGMLLLITDPATSPNARTGKVLYGVAYGAMVFALFPLLEDWGSYGYFDKLLPVPILNLLVRRFDAVGDRWGATLEERYEAATAWLSSGRRAAVVPVAAWVAFFMVIRVGDAFGGEHPGRDIALWTQACDADKPRACRTYYELLANGCRGGKPEACHNLAAELVARKRTADGKGPEHFFGLACDAGLAVSCGALAELRGQPPTGGAEPGAADPLGNNPLAAQCRTGEAAACHNLGAAFQRGIAGAPDIERAMAAYDAGCKLGMAQSCSSVAALAMQRGGDVDKARAAEAFAKACAAGDAPGCANLALMKLKGDGVPQDLEGAADHHRKACELGLGMACLRLGEALQLGQGLPRDLDQAQKLFAKACALGVQPACPKK